MSKYKWSDPDSWDTFCYVEKGSEKLGFFQTYLELEDLERQLDEVMTGLTLIESSLINLRPRDKSPIDRRFGDLIKDILQLKEQGR